MGRWFLQGAFSNATTLQEIPLNPLPQVLGRDAHLVCVIQNPTVSRQHARVETYEQQLLLTDLNSSNGTYVNRQRINTPTLIDHGDIIHLGTSELRLINRAAETLQVRQPDDVTRILGTPTLSDKFPAGIKELQQLIELHSVNIVYQPIIRAKDLQCVGYEALCRGADPHLPMSPLDLFKIAESFNLEVQLSEMLRNQSLAQAHRYQLGGEMLINTHPAEIANPDRLIQHLTQLHQQYPHSRMTLEIHEQSITEDSHLLKQLKKELRKLTIKLAFDDFGVGQSRLMEMIEAKPDLIKFNKKLIEEIHLGGTTRIHLVRTLLNFAKELKIATLAECVCSTEEYNTCRVMGFEFYQGYHFEKPRPAEFFAAQARLVPQPNYRPFR